MFISFSMIKDNCCRLDVSKVLGGKKKEKKEVVRKKKKNEVIKFLVSGKKKRDTWLQQIRKISNHV